MVYRKGIHIDWKGRGAHLAQAPAPAPRFRSSLRKQANTVHASQNKVVLPEGNGTGTADTSLPGALQMDPLNAIHPTVALNKDVADAGPPLHIQHASAFRLMPYGRQSKDTAAGIKKDTTRPKAGKIVAMLGGGLLAGGLAVFLLILELVALVWLILLASLIAVGLLKESIDLSKKMKNWFKYLVHILAWPVLVVSAVVLIACVLIVALQDKGL